MTHTEMEEALENLDRRMSSIEQILPTLATKTDLREGLGDAKRHANVLVEAVRDDIRIVAEGVAALVTKVDALTDRVHSLTGRLEKKDVI